MNKEVKSNGVIIAYDRSTLPKDKVMKDISESIKKDNICYWDSSNGGSEPRLLDLRVSPNEPNKYEALKFVDLNDKQIKNK